MKIILILMVVLSSTVFGWFLPYSNPENIVYPDSSDLDTRIYNAWQSYKSNYVETNGLIFKKYDSDYNNGSSFDDKVDSKKYCVSEGIGYAMLIALYLNDQTTFDKVYSAGKKYFGYPSLNGASWKVAYDKNNVNSAYSVGGGSATDADLDVATALVFAAELAKAGYWSNNNYSTEANTLIDAIYNKDQSGGWMKLGTNWGGSNEQNPSYFAPGYFRLYDAWQGTSRWGSVISNHYSTISKNPGYSKGIIRNWCNVNGGVMTTGSYWQEQSKYMSWEAIRVPWRIAVDGLWYNSSEANKFANNAMSFASDPDKLGTGMFLATSPYTMQEDASWLRATPKAMWGGLAGLVDKDLLDKYAQRLQYYSSLYKKQFNEDNHYYNASLTLLGALTLSGSFANIYEDIKKGVSTKNELLKPLYGSVDLNSPVNLLEKGQLNIYAKTSMASDWTITITGKKSGIVMEFSGYGTTPMAEWKVFKDDNDNFFINGETIEVSLSAGTVSDSKEFVLTQLPDKYNINLLDDFEDMNDVNNYGSTWEIITDQSSGGNSTGDFVVVGNNGSSGNIEFNYNLDQGNASKAMCGLYSYFSSDKSKIADFKYISYFKVTYKGAASRIELIPSNDIDGMSSYYGVDLDEATDWTTVLIPSYKMYNPDDAGSYSTKVSSIKAVRIVPQATSGSGKIEMDDIVFIGNIGLEVVATNKFVNNKNSNLLTYPNPFNPYLNILYRTNSENKIKIRVYDINGKLIKELYNKKANNGIVNLRWKATCNSGVYFIYLTDGKKVLINKSVLVK